MGTLETLQLAALVQDDNRRSCLKRGFKHSKMNLMAITLIAAAGLGVFIGVLSGLLGIGGGTVMVPMYRLAFGMSALASTATSIFTIIPTSVSGVVSHIRNGTCIPKLGLAMGIGGACTSPLGVWLASISPSWAVMLAAALVIGYSALNMLKKVRDAPRAPKDSGAAGASAGAAPKPSTVARVPRPLPPRLPRFRPSAGGSLPLGSSSACLPA